MIIIGCSKGMSTSLTAQMIPQKISAMLMGISDNMVVTLLIMNAMLLIVGTFMDMSPAILIFTPILYTVFRDIHGIHPPDLMGIPAEKWLPIHFGTIIIANLCIGLCTPPVGTCLFLGCGVGKTKIADTAWKMFPFFIAMLVALMLITFIPEISIALPKWLGLL
jgi:TRAP-type C4-dicarboxylate transport system permease large subunit